VSADTSELLAFAQHLDYAIERAEPQLSKVVERGAFNVKRDSIANIKAQSRGRYLKHYPKSITYEMVGDLEAEVGPDSSKMQGGMGLGVELGSAHTAPEPHLFPAADVEEPRFGKSVADIVWRSMK
jgi:hypothetical protein